MLAGAAVAVCATLAAAAPPPRSAVTGASAVLVQVTIPGQETVSLGDLTWPTNLSADVQSFQYPDDGSIVSLGRSRATVSAQPGEAATAQSSAEAVALSLFAGEIVAAQVTASITAGASQRSAGADISASAVRGLRALGQDVPASPDATSPLADWGVLSVLSQDSGSRRANPPGAQGSTVALRVTLTVAHGGLPEIGRASCRERVL